MSTHIAKKVLLGPNNAAYIIYVHIHFPEPKSNVSLNVNLHHQIRLLGPCIATFIIFLQDHYPKQNVSFRLRV